jgi:thymidylate kinase
MTTPRVIALEGVGGVGKSSLAKPLAEALGARLIKRPLTSPPDLPPDQLRWWMLDDAADCLDLARQSTEPYIILDRHWLSAAIYQDPASWPRPLRHYRAALGEPDVWVILSIPATEAIHRLRDRSADGRRHLDHPARLDLIAGRIALYDDAAHHHLSAPIIDVRLLPPVSPTSYARWEIRSRYDHTHHTAPMTPEDMAQIVAQHVRALTGDKQ